MTCESVRGQWGGRCPDCGQMLPSIPGPLMSEKARAWAERITAGSVSGVSGRSWSPKQVEAYRTRKFRRTSKALRVKP